MPNEGKKPAKKDAGTEPETHDVHKKNTKDSPYNEKQKNNNKGGNKGNQGKKGKEGVGTSNSKMVTCGTQSSARGTREDKEKEENNEEGEKKEETKKEENKKPKPERKERVKEYFREEIQRLKKSLEDEGKKIVQPERKEFTPYTFTTLAPYIDIHSLEFLLNYPDEPDLTHTSRNVSFGMTDPADDLRLDNQPESTNNKKDKKDKKKKKEEKKEEKKEDKKEDRPPKEGSTRLPKFPCVAVEPGEMSNKKISYADVPKLREEIKNKYSKNADTKVVEEYERTKQDFYRMELDKMEEIHPVNRPHMRAAYFAYLQNNPGSRKAVYECLKTMGEKKDEDGEDNHDGSTTARSNRSTKSRTSEKS